MRNVEFINGCCLALECKMYHSKYSWCHILINEDFCFCKGPSIGAETTPAKSQRTESLGGLASPLVAACAPSGAALPLPSSTTSPIPSQDAKPAAVRQRTPSSIKQWLSPRRGSPGQVSPPLRRVLSPCPQSPASGTSPTERRAKRRLETGDSASASCEGAEQCDCVTELYPAAKRSRAPSGICCPTQESRVQTDCHAEDKKQVSSRQTDKENCSPRAIDWLSVMGQKMRNGQGSPSTPRSPSASKKQEGKTPASPVSTKIPASEVIQFFWTVPSLSFFVVSIKNVFDTAVVIMQD